MTQLEYRVRDPVANAALQALFTDAWGDAKPGYAADVLTRSLGWVTAHDDAAAPGLVGFVNVAWDGGEHAFLLDTTVASTHRRRGIGRELVRRAANLARDHHCAWLHADYPAALAPFYAACGLRPTAAGLIDLSR